MIRKQLSLILIILFSTLSAVANGIDTEISNDNLEAIKKLTIEEISTSKATRLKNTILIEAITKNATKITEYIISRGIGLNVKNYLGKTPLMIAFQMGRSEKFIRNLVDNGASPFLKDRQNRSIEYYARYSRKQNLIDLASSLLSSSSTPTEADINELIKGIKSKDDSALIHFFDKHGHLYFSLNNKTDISYFLANDAFETWGLNTFLEFGYEINQRNFLHNVLKAKKFQLAEELVLNHASLLETGLNNAIPLMMALKYGAPTKLIDLIISKMRRFNMTDDGDNNLLHYAIKFNFCSTFNQLTNKNISLDQINTDNETPAMLLAKSNCINHSNFSSIVATITQPNKKNKNGDTFLHNLANYNPGLITENYSALRNMGTDFTATNNKQKSIIDIIKEKDPNLLADSNFDELDIESIPDFNIENKLEYPKAVPSIELDEVNEYQNHSQKLLGSSEFQVFLASSVNSLINANKAKFTKELEGKTQESSKSILSQESVSMKEEEISVFASSISNKKTRLSNLIQMHQANKAQYDAKVEKEKAARKEWLETNNKIKNSVSLYNRNYETLANSIQDINDFGEEYRDFKELLQNKSLIEQTQITSLKNDISAEIATYNFDVSEINKRYQNEIYLIARDLNTSTNELSEKKNFRNRIQNTIARLEREKVNNENRYNQAYRDMRSDAHKNVHETGFKSDEKTYRCSYLQYMRVEFPRKRKHNSSQLKAQRDQLKTVEARIKKLRLDKQTARKEYQKEKKRLESLQKDELAKIKVDHDHDLDVIKRKIEALEVELNAKLQEKADAYHLTKKQFEDNFGDLQLLHSEFQSISSVYSILNSGIDAITSSKLFLCSAPGLTPPFVCGLNDNQLFGEPSPNNNIFYSILSKLGSQLSSYKDKEFYLKTSTSAINTVSLYSAQISNLSQEIEADHIELEKLKEEQVRLTEKTDETNGSSVDHLASLFIQDFRQALIPEEFIFNFTPDIKSQINSQLNEFNNSPQIDDFAAFIKKISIKPESVTLNIDDFNPDSDFLQKKFSKSKAKYAVSKYLKEMGYTQGQTSLLAEAIIQNSSIYLISQNSNHSLRIDGPNGSFSLNKDGTILEFKNNDIENYKFMSEDTNFQRQAKGTLDKLSNIEKSTLSSNDIEKFNFAFEALKEADRFEYQGKIYESQLALSISDNIADTIMGVTPILSVGKDAFEAITGKNFVTGVKLSTEDWYLAIFSLATAGTLSQFKKINSILRPLLIRLKSKLLSYDYIKEGLKTIYSARKLGLKAKEEFQLFTKLAGNNRGSVGFIDDFAESTKSVWNRLGNKGPNWTGSNIPKHFEVTAGSEKFFVNPNATKHMNEYVSSYFRSTTHSAPVHSQMLLNSFEGSVKSAVKSGNWKKSMETGEAIIQDGWELVFKKQRAGETLPVIKHARRVN